MGRMWPPQRVKMWFTPACLSVFATSSPPVSSAISGPQVGVAHDVRFAELRRGAGADDLPLLEEVAVVGERQGLPGVLLHQEHRRPLAVDRLDHLENLLHQERRRAGRGLGEQGEPRPPHQGAPDGEHRLLAAAHRRRDLPAPLPEAREPVEDLLQPARGLGRPPPGEGPHPAPPAAPPWAKAPTRRSSPAVIFGKIRRPSGTTPIPRLTIWSVVRPSIRSPRKRMEPVTGRTMPRIVRIKGGFPAPFGPSRQAISPSPRVIETFRSMEIWPYRVEPPRTSSTRRPLRARAAPEVRFAHLLVPGDLGKRPLRDLPAVAACHHALAA